jgi:tetratricopeptide (TPR) repeat protein
MPGSRITVDGEPFLGRLEEQERFRDALRDVLQQRGLFQRVKDLFKEQEQNLPYVFLLHGEGGMGKTQLSKRLRDIAKREPSFEEKFRILWLDWQNRKERDYRLRSRDTLSPEIVFEHIYTVFRDAGFGRQFDPYEQAVSQRSKAETKVAQALDRTMEQGDRYQSLRQLGAKGLAWLVRSGTVGGVPIPLPQEATVQTFETIIESGARNMAQLRETATGMLRAALEPEEFDLFTLPHETLAMRLAEGICAASRQQPIVLVLDTYEIADRPDPWLRMVIKRSGPNVVWILAGRDRLDESRRYGDSYFTGYRADFPSDRLRVFPLGEFSIVDVEAYFAERVPERPLESKQADAVHRATLGIPLAVREAASIWAEGASIEAIISDMPPRPERQRIVNIMTERFLLHCFDDPGHPDERVRLYAIALAYQPDADLLAAMLESDDLEADLGELERRYSFVFVTGMELHHAVESFLHEYLCQEIRRRSAQVQELHQRAINYLQERKALLEERSTTLETRLEDERWAETVLGLTHHTFWLEQEDGWVILLPAFVGGLAYDQDFSRALLEVAEPLAGTFTQAGQRRLDLLEEGLSPRFDADIQAAFLDELEISRSQWPSDGCSRERRAILAWKRGQICFHQERYDDALRAYERAERVMPEENEKLKRLLGEALYQVAGEFLWPEGRSDAVPSSQAERIMSKAIEWLPEKPDAWYRLGVALSLAGKSEEAIAAYQRAIELDPQDAYPHNGLGNVYDDLDRHEEAIAAYQRAIKLEPEYAYPHNGLGNVYDDLDRHEEAIAAYQQAIELEPEYGHPHNGLGIVYRKLDRHEEAIAAYQRAIELDPEDAYPHNGLGNVYAQMDRHEEAVAAFQRAIELDPEYESPHNGLGNVYAYLDRYEEAITAYQRAIELGPEYATPHNGLGNVYRQLDRQEEAIAAYQQAIELEPEYGHPHNGLGIVYRKLDRHEEAIAAYQRAIELDPEFAWAYNNLGLVYEKQKEYEQAVSHYRQAIQFHSQDQDKAISWRNLGDAYRALERYDEAINAYQRTIELDPEASHSYDRLGLVYRNLGRYDDAIPVHQKAIELDPEYATAYSSLAACYRKLGRADDYEKQLEIARPLMEDESEYNQACFAAVAGETDEALSLLETAIQEEQVPLDWVYRDPDFDFIRDDPRFQTLLDQFDKTE